MTKQYLQVRRKLCKFLTRKEYDCRRSFIGFYKYLFSANWSDFDKALFQRLDNHENKWLSHTSFQRIAQNLSFENFIVNFSLTQKAYVYSHKFVQISMAGLFAQSVCLFVRSYK